MLLIQTLQTLQAIELDCSIALGEQTGVVGMQGGVQALIRKELTNCHCVASCTKALQTIISQLRPVVQQWFFGIQNHAQQLPGSQSEEMKQASLGLVDYYTAEYLGMISELLSAAYPQNIKRILGQPLGPEKKVVDLCRSLEQECIALFACVASLRHVVDEVIHNTSLLQVSPAMAIEELKLSTHIDLATPNVAAFYLGPQEQYPIAWL